MTCFLDLNERRCNGIPADASMSLGPSDEQEPRLLAMDDGLVCGLFSSFTFDEQKLVMVDPTAKARREVPTSTSDGKTVCCEFCDWNPQRDDLPVIVTVVDNADCSSKVFVMNGDCIYARAQTGIFVYESSTDAWRDLEMAKLGLRISSYFGGCLEESAGFFQGNLYAVVQVDGDDTIIVSNNLQENPWRQVLGVEVKDFKFPQLIVSGNRMFVAIWSDPSNLPPLPNIL